MDYDEDDICPLCAEDLDLNDRSFHPCECGYQVREPHCACTCSCSSSHANDPISVSRFASFAGIESSNQATPNALTAARPTTETRSPSLRPIPKSTHLVQRPPQRARWHLLLTFDDASRHRLQKQTAGKKKEKQRKQQEAHSRKNAANVRVIQKNLVYVTNLAMTVAKEEVPRAAARRSLLPHHPPHRLGLVSMTLQILRKFDFFGQYGKIVKIVINKNNLYNATSPHGPSVSAYVTFANAEDARVCIKAVDGSWLENRVVR